ncbi:DNA repair protein XRCC3 isoform 1-T1 [Synchiropus picturatus]
MAEPSSGGRRDWDQLELHPRIRAAVSRGSRPSRKSCVLLSWSCRSPPACLAQTSSAFFSLQHRPAGATPPTPVNLLDLEKCKWLDGDLRLSLGCPLLDQLLRGGLPVGGITELAGESGAGKTQLALQLCLSVQFPRQHGGMSSGAVFISTEDSFPSKRLQQLIIGQRCLRQDVPEELVRGLRFSDNIYVEHAADLAALQKCLTQRVPLLLARGLVRLLVVDSVASLFRCEFEADDWLNRARELTGLSSTLRHLGDQFGAAVLCINQVTDVFSSDGSLGPLSSSVAPALGLTWANMVTIRLMMHRLREQVSQSGQCSALRRLEVVFAPHLARDGRHAAVWMEGVRGVQRPESSGAGL